MGPRADQLAADAEAATADVIAFVVACDDGAWGLVVEDDGRTVAQLADHVADGHLLAVDWYETVRAGRPITVTAADLDAHNARRAGEVGQPTRAAVVARLREGIVGLAAALRALDDAQLDSLVSFGPAGGAELPVEGLGGVAARHQRRHLAEMRRAIGAR